MADESNRWRLRSLDWQGCGPAQRLNLLLASGCGLGLSPIASGTFGTLPGILIALAVYATSPLWLAIVLAVGFVLVAVPICDAAEKHFGSKDDGRVVADEYLTFPLCVLGLPLDPAVLLVAFLSHRLLDIWKPPPARQLQNLTGGVGIVIDDVISSSYALVLNHVLCRVLGLV